MTFPFSLRNSRWRAWLRVHTPLSVPKAKDCGAHDWRNGGQGLDFCLHCEVRLATPPVMIGELIRAAVENNAKRGPRDRVLEHEPPDLSTDSAAALVALLAEQAGGSVALRWSDVREVAERLVLLPLEGEDGISFEVRRLAPDVPGPLQSPTDRPES
jgi:hypothetical protein